MSTFLTFEEAAQAVGKSRATIFNYVKSGKISAVDNSGKRQIDTSELLRVFGELQAVPDKHVKSKIMQNESKNSQNIQIDTRLDKRYIDNLEQQLDDCKSHTKSLLSQNQQLLNIITDKEKKEMLLLTDKRDYKQEKSKKSKKSKNKDLSEGIDVEGMFQKKKGKKSKKKGKK
jgi:predicted site-specific integrase-resolvase